MVSSSNICFDVHFALRFRGFVLIAFVAATLFLCSQLKNIKLTVDPLESMYPPGHPFLPALQAVKKMVPEPRMLVGILEVKKGDIYNAETIRKIDSITREMIRIEGILPDSITSLTMGMDHYDNTAEGLSIEPILGRIWPKTQTGFEALKRRIAVNPMGLGRYVSYDGTATMITGSLVDTKEKARISYEALHDSEKVGLPLKDHEKKVKAAFESNLAKAINTIKSRVDDHNYTVHFMGPQLIEAQMTSMGKRHIPIAAAVMLLLILFLLAVYFRTFCGILVPLFAMVFSLLWAMGIYAACGIEFNPMALTFPLILGVFSLAYSVLGMKHYYHSYNETGNKSQAFAAAYGNTPVLASILTGGLVTSVLYAAGVPMIKELGCLALFWLVGTTVVVTFISPVLISFFPEPDLKRVHHRKDVFQAVAARLTKPSVGKGKYPVLVFMVALLVLGGFSAGSMEAGDNIPGSSYIRPGHPWNQCFDLLSRKFMGPYQLLVYAKAQEKGGLLDPEAINAMGDLSRYSRDQCGARDSIAFDMMIRMARHMLMDGNPKWQTVPLSRDQVKRLAALIVEQGGVEDFIDMTFTEATVSPFFPEKDSERIDEYASMLQSYIDRHPSGKLEFLLGGGLLGMTKVINDGTGNAYSRIFPMALALLFVLGSLVTGSILLGSIITLPVAGAQALVWVIMAATGLKISMPVVLVSAAGVGFGSVFGYYLVRLYTMSFNVSEVHVADIRSGFGKGGGTALFLGILVFSALLPWFFIGLKFQSNMSLLLGMTVILEALLSLLFIPALVSLCRVRSSD